MITFLALLADYLCKTFPALGLLVGVLRTGLSFNRWLTRNPGLLFAEPGCTTTSQSTAHLRGYSSTT